MGGGGSTYDYGFRIYNPSIAKFLSVDPLSPEYPWYTPYQFAGNTPIAAIDLDGLEENIVINEAGKQTGSHIVKQTSVEVSKKLAINSSGKLVEIGVRGGIGAARLLSSSIGAFINVIIPADAGVSAQFASLLTYEEHRFRELSDKPYTILSENEKRELNNYYGKYEIGKDGSINVRPMASDDVDNNIDPPGIIYLRIDKEGLLKPYVGQTKSEERYEARQTEHDRNYPYSDFEYTIIDRGHSGQDLNQREQMALDDRNGPTNKSHPEGGTSNKRNVIRKK